MSKNLPQFTIGELINVQIRGARVENLRRTGTCTFALLRFGGSQLSLPLHNTAVTVERVAPAQWPPQPGDVWEDRNKAKWFGTTRGDGVRLTSAHGDTWSDFGEVLRDVGPMRLLYRDGWTPTADTTPAEAGPVDERAELVAGYRALADIIETHPELTDLPRYVHWQPTPEQQDAWVEALGGATRSDHPHEQTIQHWAKTKLRGLNLDVTWIEDLPATQPDEPVEDGQADADPEAPVPAPAELIELVPATRESILAAIAENDRLIDGHEPAPLPHRAPDADATSLLAESLADGAA